MHELLTLVNKKDTIMLLTYIKGNHMKYFETTINHIKNSYEYRINEIRETLPDLGYDLETRFNYHYSPQIQMHECDEEFHKFDFSYEISEMKSFRDKCVFDLPVKIENCLYYINNTENRHKKYRYYKMLQNACESVYKDMILKALDIAPDMPDGNIFTIALKKMDDMGL